MTQRHDMTRPQIDKHDLHFRQQLSAMLDGELAPDQAKFMLRRLQHDGELAACWERWQVCGDILRGRHDALLPRDFSRRVTQAIADADGAAAMVATDSRGGTRQPRWARWGGGAALAASVAMAALFVARQPAGPDPAVPVAPPQVAANAAPAPDAPAPVNETPAAPDAAGAATVLATVAVVAEVPRRAAQRADQRRSRAQDQRAAARVRRQAEAPVMVAANAPAPSTPAPPATDTVSLAVAPQAGAEALDPAVAPFVAQPPAPSRPWPRAILPEFRGDGLFSASYGTPDVAASHPFHPFEPRTELLTTSSGDTVPADDQP